MIKRLLIRLMCWDYCPIAFHHGRLRIVQEFGGSRKIQCVRCGKYFGMNDEVRGVLPWDSELEHLYADVLGYGRTIR